MEGEVTVAFREYPKDDVFDSMLNEFPGVFGRYFQRFFVIDLRCPKHTHKVPCADMGPVRALLSCVAVQWMINT